MHHPAGQHDPFGVTVLHTKLEKHDQYFGITVPDTKFEKHDQSFLQKIFSQENIDPFWFWNVKANGTNLIPPLDLVNCHPQLKY
jgi:hypothetical protein